MAEDMTNEQAISLLKANRHMRSNEEFQKFEDSLAFLVAHPNTNDLPDLHLALDDDCDQHEVMFGLVHFIEDFDLEAQLKAFLSVIPELIVKAPSWTRTLTVRVLNNEPARAYYKDFLQSTPSTEKALARGILEKIVASRKVPLEERAGSSLIISSTLFAHPRKDKR